MSKLLFQTVGGTLEQNSIIDHSDPQESLHLLQSNLIMSLTGEEFNKDMNRPATSSHSDREPRNNSIEMSTTSTKYRDNLGNVYEVVH